MAESPVTQRSNPETPGSIHEGGELGYSISHAFGAAFDNPDLIVTVVVGDGKAETGPLATAWHSNKFLNHARDAGVHFKEWLRNQVIENTNHANEYGVDKAEFAAWKWPYSRYGD